MAQLKNKISGSTLIEVLVAMIIIITISTLTSALILNIYMKSNVSRKIEAFLLLDNEIERTLFEKDYDNQKLEMGIFIIDKNVQIMDHPNLITVNFKILDQENRLILERNKIVMKDTIYMYFNEKD